MIAQRIIPDKILEAHTCRLCDKYLTVSPISVHPDGGNICGRCQKSKKPSQSLFHCTLDLPDQTSIPYTIFSYANHLFPCINRYERCSTLMPFDEVKQHEKNCLSIKTLCGFCEYEGTGSQQLYHFRKLHKKNIFENIHFRFPLHQKYRTNLIKRDNLLFILDVTIISSKIVMMSVKSTNQILDNNIEFFCLFKNFFGEVFDQLTLTRRTADKINHQIDIRDESCSFEKYGDVYCECLLRKQNVFL